MKRFLFKIGLFFIPCVLSLYVIFLQADGYTDPFYNRFTVSKQKSFVLGTSRAAQGVVPEVLNNKLERNDIYNYAFTLGHSPYGEIYLNSIKRKLKKTSNQGLFIITVDPWSLTTKISSNITFEESKRFLNDMPIVSQKPNAYYLIKHFDKPYRYIFLNKKKSKTYLHENGWLEVDIKWDSLSMEKRIKEKVDIYSKSIELINFSEIRIKSLQSTIKYLKNHGKVYLVRLPIHPKMMSLENMLAPQFERIIGDAIVQSDGYLNLTHFNKDFKYTDGNHLHKSSAKVVSEIIAQWIINQRQ